MDKRLSRREKCEGATLSYRIGNRFSGGGVSLVSLLAITTGNLLAITLGGPLFIEGLGDVFSGKHHYLASKIYGLITRKDDFYD